ncbi:hypothetical protein ACVWXO_006185 [Bradyrhizobium sp. LM2.7]
MDKRFFHYRDDACWKSRASILLFGRAAGHSSVPAINLAAAARRGGQGWPHLRPPQGLALTGPSTVARCMERDWPGWKLPSAAITDEMDKRFFHYRDDACWKSRASILLFGRAAGHSSVPAINLAAAARRGGQGWPHLRPPQGLALTGPSTVARCMERDWPGWKLPSAAIMVVGRGRPRGEA